MDPEKGPLQLQRKVMFDIRYFFCLRGSENFQQFTKGTFKLMFDVESGISYVQKVEDEMSKNHHETNHEIITGFMPQMLNSQGTPHHLCPVRSFENYTSHLNPKIESLWQRPLINKPSDPSAPWYTAVPLGHNPIEKFMSKLSTTCSLSDYYTNHCIRVTGATNLTRSNDTAKQVMCMTGYKSIQSLSIYQKVREDDKLSMDISLTYSLMHPGEVSHLQELIQQERKSLENSTTPMPNPPKALPAPVAPVSDPPNLPLHALDPANKNILPLESALVPCQQQQQNPHKSMDTNDFDLMALLHIKFYIWCTQLTYNVLR